VTIALAYLSAARPLEFDALLLRFGLFHLRDKTEKIPHGAFPRVTPSALGRINVFGQAMFSHLFDARHFERLEFFEGLGFIKWLDRFGLLEEALSVFLIQLAMNLTFARAPLISPQRRARR
jgi:hypothetical protein